MLKDTLIKSADAIVLTNLSFVTGVSALATPEVFPEYVILSIISAVVFFVQYYLEWEVGILSNLLRWLKGGSK